MNLTIFINNFTCDQSEKHELFPNVTNNFIWNHFKNVEMDGFGKCLALPDDYNISFLNRETGRAMDWNISMSLLVSVIFGHIVQIVPSHDNGSLHFSRDHYSLENLASDRYIARERTFFIYIVAVNGLLGSPESQTDALEISDSSGCFLGKQFLAIEEDIVLFLECSFVLKLT